MIKKILVVGIATLSLSSCVSKKVYEDLESKYAALRSENIGSTNDLDQMKEELKSEQDKYEASSEALNALKAKHSELVEDSNSTKATLKNLQASYTALEANSSASIAKNSKKNRELLKELEEKQNELAEKQKELTKERSRLEQLQEDLAERSNRIDQLEAVIAAKDANLRNLKDAISKALTDFEGKGLTVEQRDGKVYVSLENKLLFASGSWTVGDNGKTAVAKLGKVLSKNPNISVLIEGHTDDVPYSGNGNLQGNWDLSAKRATAIVKILRENKKIDPKTLTAAGRGEFAPIAPNDTAENKAKNRRIEVVLTPKLDEVNALLQDID